MEILQGTPSPELEQVLQEGFQEESAQDGHTTNNNNNAPSFGPQVAFSIQENHQYIAAVIVKHFWGALHIKKLWTHKGHRKKGLATALMLHAEDYAKRQKLALLFVETFSFQALGFYRDKMGFTLEFTREGYADGAAFHYLSKKMELGNQDAREERR